MTDNNLHVQGFYKKYKIEKTDGSPIDPEAKYFVLRYDQDSQWGDLSRAAIWDKLDSIEALDPILAADLRSQIEKIGLWSVFTNDVTFYVAATWKDLEDLYSDVTGHDMEDREDLSDWYCMLHDKEITIRYDEDDFVNDQKIPKEDAKVVWEDDEWKVTATARTWAKANGRGLLVDYDW